MNKRWKLQQLRNRKTLNAINESSFVILCAGLLSLFHRDLIWDEKTTTVTTREKTYDKNISVTFIRSVSLSYPSRGNSPFLSGNLTSVSPAFFIYFFHFFLFISQQTAASKTERNTKIYNVQWGVRRHYCCRDLTEERAEKRKKSWLHSPASAPTHCDWIRVCIMKALMCQK